MVRIKMEEYVLVAQNGMKMDDKVFLLRRKRTTLEVRPQVVDPTKTTTLSTPLETRVSSNVSPTPLSIAQHVSHQLLVFLRRPQTLPELIIHRRLVLAVSVFFHVFSHGQLWLSHD